MIAGEAMRLALRSAADRTLILGESGTLTGAELNAAIDALSADIRSLVGPLAAVGVWYWNSAHAMIAHLAIERAGATRVPVDPSAAPAEATAIFQAAGVELVVADTEHSDPSLGAVLVYDDGHEITSVSPIDLVEVPDDATALLYPRTVSAAGLLAIPISFANWESCMRLNAALFCDGTYGPALSGAECFLTTQQMMHGTGLIGTFPFLHLGLPQVILRQFEPAEVVETLATFGITTAFMVPGMVTRLADELGEHRQELRLKRVIYGGAPISADDMRRSAQILGPVLVQIYGRLEGGWPLTYLSQTDHADIAIGHDSRHGSCGKAIPGVELEIKPLVPDPNAAGELRVRGPMVSPSFRNPDGWCSLGDLATCDSDGYYTLHGRLDGMINTGSYHVYPAEVQETIESMFPGTQVTVAAEPDPKWGQAVAATITWAPGETPPTDDAFRRTLAGRLARYKIPTRLTHHREQ